MLAVDKTTNLKRKPILTVYYLTVGNSKVLNAYDMNKA